MLPAIHQELRLAKNCSKITAIFLYYTSNTMSLLSPWKFGQKSSTEKSYFLFPAIKCLFCEKGCRQNKKQEQKEGPNEAFANRKHKSFGLESIKKMAREMQNDAYSSLFNRVTAVNFSICFQLRFIFINHAIHFFTANTNHLRYIFCRQLEKQKELKNCRLRRMLKHTRE